jgi:LmbE family N-acetylglucosaminyl deacetylase
MDYPDEFLFDDEGTRRAFIDMVRKANPDVIFAHYPSDYHPDHNTSGCIVRDLKVMTSVPNIETPTAPMDHIPEIFFMDTIAGVGFEPEEYVDISETIELKKQMLACHVSQSAWLERQYGMTYIEFMDVVNRFRGIQIGVKYAEAFRFCRSWPSGIGRNLLP